MTDLRIGVRPVVRALDEAMWERDEARATVIALTVTLTIAVSRLAQHGAPYDDVLAVLNQEPGRILDVATLLAQDPEIQACVSHCFP
jgi:hypothetical protein